MKEGSLQAGPSSSIVLRQIKEQLLHAGYEVAEQIGQSDFKCSLAVKVKPEDETYALGILVDDGKHYQNGNLIEQYYQRPAILQNFGWKVLAVFAKDWLHQPQKVMEQILKLLGEEVPTAQGSSNENNIALTPFAGQEKLTGVQPGIYDHLDFQRLTNQEAGSEKFWETATDGSRLVVRWGRTGSKGQIQLKTFSDEESAIKEKLRLIREKTGKGYKF
jgi:predicted DNA-binding WGR domain protein